MSEWVVYTLILGSSKIQEEDDVDESTKKIKDKLIESTYLMLEELPQGLPFIREIQHWINLVLIIVYQTNQHIGLSQ
jgi:hypothetical protein